MTKDLADTYGYTGESGVLVTRVDAGSAAAQLGIRPGILILEVNHRGVGTVKEFRDALAAPVANDTHLFLLKDGRFLHYAALKIEAQ